MRSSVLLAVFGTSLTVLAHPRPSFSGNGVQQRGVDISSFPLDSHSQYTNGKETVARGLHRRKNDNYVDAATQLVKSIAPEAEFRLVKDHYIGTNGVGHVFFKQTLHGLDIDNADFNVNVNPDGSILSYGNSFFSGAFPTENPLTKRAFTDPSAALAYVAKVLNLPVKGDAFAVAMDAVERYVLSGTSGAQSDPEARLIYLNKDGELALNWRIETDVLDNWLLSYVDAITNEKINAVVDYVSDADAKYEVYPWPAPNPVSATRKTVTDAADKVASEFGWHSDGASNYTTLRGNNAIAQTNPDGGSDFLNEYRPNSLELDFRYSYSPSMNASSAAYRDASITQLFYTSNKYHDLLFHLGFNDLAGNFETTSTAGLGNDSVILNTMDGSGVNNANFATPEDGKMPRMRMYIWNYTTPARDSSFDAGVVVHEYTHGLSNRLTGGPKNSACLQAVESKGMGEGWSDAMANALRIKVNDTRSVNLPMGDWISGRVGGIRSQLYSTSLSTNNHTYVSVNGITQQHRIGERWASMLYEVMWNLMDKHGITSDTTPKFEQKGGYATAAPTDGRYLFMKLVIDGMALQPCNPNFVQARDAILDADKHLTGGQNQCEIWSGFAKRGLGADAKYGTVRTGSTKIPDGVCKN